MYAFQDNPAWHKARFQRRFQIFFGWISGICLAVALAALFDGLQALMRAGANEMVVYCGQTVSLSGPAALKNPLNSDVVARFSPQTSPLTFELEGFFTGYWMGNGMWRGQITVPQDTKPGKYLLNISFKGASAKTVQRYTLHVFANARDWQTQSRSIFRRVFGISPFIIGSVAGILGILTGSITYYFGRKFAFLLADIGLAEIYDARKDRSIYCFTPLKTAPKKGQIRMVLTPDGEPIAEAGVEKWEKGRLKLILLEGKEIPEYSLVSLKPHKKADLPVVEDTEKKGHEEKNV